MRNNISIENARIIFRNFAGRKSEYNKAGNRTFAVIIEDKEKANELLEDGWNIKILKPRDEDEEIKHYLPVDVSFGIYPPTVYSITKRRKVQLNEDTIETLDYVDISFVDVIIRPYNWEVKSKNGIERGKKAYVKTMYVNIDEDEFANKYAMEEAPEEMPFD